MARVFRVLAGAIVSPLVAVGAAYLWLSMMKGGRGNELLWALKIATTLSYVWFLVFFAPIAFALSYNGKATTTNLVVLGTITGALGVSGALLLVLAFMGHGGTQMNVAGALGQAALYGAPIGAVIGVIFALVSGITIRSRRP